ncbi:hypothetical protein SAMN04488063_1446 [Halopelagius inordinatus]|uniref:Halobacterial output domain-containing protein n=1 Tax=Halopelagius inordinatus TaxID=553467 RepID=A0A1I2P4A7_9EURY|nr:HalOD1 output domain-containing protein [Halopelagius inordinatus]SFG10928.1 hypothetical protein SAMN04488063_1446 [Halopelagius inordinatus]
MDQIEEHRARWDTEEGVAVAVVKAVAEATNTDPFELEPLHSAMDTGVLDSVAESDSEYQWRLEFEYAGVQVELVGTGDLTVTGFDGR